MAQSHRRTPEEWAFNYERYPHRRDVFVLGPYDASILNWFLVACECPNAVVYDIDTVEITYQQLQNNGQRDSKRERLIFLAGRLSGLVSPDSVQFTCVIDADFAHIRNDYVSLKQLLYTDYACMEMYFFNPKTIEKFVTIVCNRPRWPAERILEGMIDTLQHLFVFRLANDELAWEMDWIPNLPLVSNEWQVTLNGDVFVTNILNANGKAGARQEYLDAVADLQSKLNKNPKMQMHGHDFTKVFSWIIRENGVRIQAAREEYLGRALAASAEHIDLKEEGLFRELFARAVS